MRVGKRQKDLLRHLNDVKAARALGNKDMEEEKFRIWLGSDKNNMKTDDLVRVMLFIYSEIWPNDKIFDEIASPYAYTVYKSDDNNED